FAPLYENSKGHWNSLPDRPRSDDDFADFFHLDPFDLGNNLGTSSTRDFDFDWDSFMVGAEGVIDTRPFRGAGNASTGGQEHLPPEPTKATADGNSDVMTGDTSSLRPWPTPDATLAENLSELSGNAPTHLSLGDDSPMKSTSPDSSRTTSTTERNRKRQRNTEAARRYRQRKVDRTAELEEALAAVSKERDELRLKLARSEAEAEVLRRMVRN
ncbi:hypothetical protein KC366_g13478, partial [Hortaea werneckii]